MQNDIEKKEPAFDSSDVRFNVKTHKNMYIAKQKQSQKET